MPEVGYQLRNDLQDKKCGELCWNARGTFFDEQPSYAIQDTPDTVAKHYGRC